MTHCCFAVHCPHAFGGGGGGGGRFALVLSTCWVSLSCCFLSLSESLQVPLHVFIVHLHVPLTEQLATALLDLQVQSEALPQRFSSCGFFGLVPWKVMSS